MSLSMNTVQRLLAMGEGEFRARRGVFGQRAVQLLGLLLDEASRAGRTDRVHEAKIHAPVFQGGELRILAADFDDGVHIGLEFAGRPGMRRDLVQHQIRSDDPAGQLAAGAGDGGAGNREGRRSAAGGVFDGRQQALDGADGVAGGAGVKPRRDGAGQRHQGRLGAGGSHVDPKQALPGALVAPAFKDLDFHRVRSIRFSTSE